MDSSTYPYVAYTHDQHGIVTVVVACYEIILHVVDMAINLLVLLVIISCANLFYNVEYQFPVNQFKMRY